MQETKNTDRKEKQIKIEKDEGAEQIVTCSGDVGYCIATRKGHTLFCINYVATNNTW